MSSSNPPKIRDERKGRITVDPLQGLAIGAEFKLRFMDYLPVIAAGAGSIDRWDHFGSGLLSIGIKTADSFSIEGSGVLIGPGLGLAARHVFDSYLDDLSSGKAVPYAISILQSGLLIWKLHQLVIGDSDVAILRLDLCSELPEDGLHLASLTTRTPVVGETVMFAGTRNRGVTTLNASHDIEVRVGVGEVTEVHPLARDSVMLPNPCIGVKCSTIGGMSGGPVFDMHGKVLGTLSSSIEDNEGPSYASLWWPSAALNINTIWPPGFIELPTNLLSLSKRGAISIDKVDVLMLDQQHGREDILYYPWS